MLLSVNQLGISFHTERDGWMPVVSDVSFDVAERSTVALVGESGSGKSVTALSILGLLPRDNARTDAGSRILLDQEDLLRRSRSHLREIRGKDVSMIFQEPMSSLNPVFSVGEQIGEVLRLHLSLSRLAARRRALDLLAEVGIPDPARRIDDYPHQLSGGQQQRVMIAMAVACEPRLLIADEPTTALDVTIQRQIMDLIRRLRESRNMSVLFITHDLGLVGEVADQVVVMRAGKVCEQGSAEQIFARPSHPYTRALLACRPPADSRPLRLRTIDDFLHTHILPPLAEKPLRPSMEGPPLLEVRHLNKTFRVRTGIWQHQSFPAVKDASFRLARGRTLGIVGESGSGKTTLGLALLGLQPADGGEILYRGEPLHQAETMNDMESKRRIQIVFQNPFASLNPRFTVAHILTEPLMLHGVVHSRDRLDYAADLLKRVGLTPESLSRYPHEFSGGQRQRIAIARCLAVRPEILVCDESVSALDVSVQAQVLNLLQDLQDEFQISYVFISHDLSVVRYMSDDVLVMQQGEIVESGKADVVYGNPTHPYTRQLLAAIPRGFGGFHSRTGS